MFNCMLADLEEVLKRGGWRGVKLKGEKLYTLAYADDVVLLAEEEGDMSSLIDRLERYLEEKGLKLNVEKLKILWFGKGGGRKKKVNCRWKRKALEEVKEFKYLGYVFQRNGEQEA
jgi:hypothetical protein